MPEHVLVALDDSEQAREALAYALREFPDARLTLLRVIDPVEGGFSARASLPGYSEEWYERARAEAEATLEAAQDEAEAAGVTASTALAHGRPAREVVEYVEEHDVDQVVMGSHGRSGVSRVLLGSVAETVLRRSPVPVTVVR